jgi:nucleoid-associated protein YgaU
MNVTVHCGRRLTAGSVFAVAVLASLVAIVAASLGSTAARAQTVAEADPPTIEKVIIGDKGVANIEGEGKPGDVVLLMSDGAAIGETAVAANGRWRVALKDGLKPGTHQIRAEARAAPQGSVTPGDEVRIAIPTDIGGQAVVAYDGVTGDPERATRRRAEELAQAAGQAFDEVRGGGTSGGSGALRQADQPKAAARESAGPVAVVIEWLKRSARGYREEVVGKLGVGVPGADQGEAAETDEDRRRKAQAAEAAATIAKERAEADTRRIDVAEADSVRKAEEAKKAEAEARKKEAARREKAEELARRKAEYDRTIAAEMERLKKAKEEADRAKSAPSSVAPRTPQQKANVTLERFYLPGQKRPQSTERADDEKRVAVARDNDDSARETSVRRGSAGGRCSEGRVIKRKGRRWYVTGADDTLWDIAERFYGSGTAYPRIYKVNRKRLSSPHVVRPCLALRLPGRRG